MKLKICVAALGIIALLFSQSANAFTNLVIVLKPAAATIKDPNPLSSMTPQQFLSLTPEKFREMTGKKMNLVQKVELKMIQHKVKKMVKRGEVVTMADVAKRIEDDSTMNILGFLLGLVLGPIGVIIVLILKDSGDMTERSLHWALIGMIIWLVWFLIWIL
jgi:hypothetical protein